MLDDGFHFLDQLPDSLYQTVVTTRHGALSERVEGILCWRRALLAGGLPRVEQLAWPSVAITERILPRLETLELAALCADQEALTDHVLAYLCVAVDSFDQWREHGIGDSFDDVSAHARHRGSSGADSGSGSGPGAGANSPAGNTDEAAQSGPSEPLVRGGRAAGPGQDPEPSPGIDIATTDDSTPAALSSGQSPGAGEMIAGKMDRAGAVAATVAAMASSTDLSDAEPDWDGLIANWRETDAVVRGMATRLGRGWDLSQGSLKIGGWREFVALRHWIKQHPELIAVVATLGRGSESSQPLPGRPRLPHGEPPQPDASQRPRPRPRQPDAGRGPPAPCPSDTRGVTRSDEIARMLP